LRLDFFRTNLKHSLLPICGKFTRALLAHQIFYPKDDPNRNLALNLSETNF
jgi:hypothetical protein